MKDLSEIASVSGKGGLFRIIKPGRVGVILESMDEKKIKIATTPNHKVSILSDISIYTTTEEGAQPLEEIFRKIHKEFGEDPGIDNKSTPEELLSFVEYIVPDYDKSRVYPSDVRKLVNWYKILLQKAPEFFIEVEEKQKETGKQVKKEKDEVKKSSDKAPESEKKEATGKKSVKKPAGKTGTSKKKEDK